MRTELDKFHETFVHAWRARELSSSVLPLVCEQVYSDPAGPYSHYLAKLTGRYAEACEFVARLAGDPDAERRKAAIKCVYEATPGPTKYAVLKQLIEDADESIAEAASWRAAHLHQRKLSEDIELRATAAVDAIRSDSIRRAAELLRTGYLIQGEGDDCISVMILYRGGVAQTVVGKEEVKEVGMATAVQRKWKMMVR